MKLSPSEEQEILQLMEDYWNSYFEGNLEKWASYIPDHYRNIGTTQEEVWDNKKQIVDYTQRVFDQMVGMADFRNKTSQVITYDPYVMVHELGDLYVKAEEDWIYYAPFRLSSLMEKTEEGWKIIHQHGSFPDLKAAEGEAFGLDAVKAENERLKKAVEERTLELELQKKELEIEAALERVRSKSLAMHQTSELQSVIHTVHEELLKLNLSIFGGSFIVINSELDNEIKCWGAGGTADTSNEVHIPRFEKPFYTNLLEGIKKGPGFFTEKYSAAEKEEFFAFLFTHEPWSKLSNEEKKKTLEAKKEYTRSCVVSEHTSIFIINQAGVPFSEADNAILKRFGKVFEQSYTRFLDLQKAEAQAREAQIEASLEKVRSTSLAMHKSGELIEVVSVLFEKLKDLNIPFTAVGIAVSIEGTKDLNAFVCGNNEQGLVVTNYRLPYFENPVPKDLNSALENQVDFFEGHYSKEEKDAFYKHIIHHTAEFKHLPEDVKEMIFSSQAYCISMVAVKNAVFNVNDFEGKSLNKNEINIIQRFARVFDQAYTRFLDLQKAEAQAREAQIEAALEKVRAQSMAMQHSNELQKVIESVYDRLVELGIEIHACTIITPSEHPEELLFWFASSAGQYNKPFHMPNNSMLIIREFFNGFKNKREIFSKTYSFQEKNKFFNYIFKHTDFKNIPENRKQLTLESKAYSICNTFREYSGIQLNRYSDNPFSREETEILVRFGKVFEQAYTRFLDLQKAEAQAREAQIQLALERVRAKTMAMKVQQDLLGVIQLFGKQLVSLGLKIDYSSIINEIITENRDWDLWGYSPLADDQPQKVLIPYTDIAYFKKTAENVENYKKSGNPIQIKTFSKAEKDEFFAHYWKFDPPASEILKEYFNSSPGSVIVDAFLGEVTVSIVKYETAPYTPEQLDIFRRFSNEFRQTYIRFLDIKKAESQARESQIESALERVRSRSMAMQTSEELQEVIKVVYEQFRSLGIPIEHTGFIMDYKEREDMNIWLADENQVHAQITFPYFYSPHWNSFREAKAKGEDFFTNLLDFETKNRFYKTLFNYIPDLPKETQEFYFAQPGLSISTVLIDNVGLYFENYTTTPFTEEENGILKRFGKVFQQTYTRFLDLQKAETQAREAQIQLALERVRARTMAMQSSEELAEVSYLLNKQVVDLGIPTRGCAFNIYDENDSLEWFSNLEGTLPTYRTPRENIFLKYYEAGQRGESLWIEEFGGERIKEHYKYLATLSTNDNKEEKIAAGVAKIPDYQIDHVAYFKYGYLLFITLVPAPEAHEIFKRFAKEFEQTYTRFLDLQKAEAQAREAKIELSLERIRAQVTSMQESSDLFDIVVAMRKEFVSLGFQADYFWHMRWTPEQYEMSMTSEDGNRIGMVINVPKFVHDAIPSLAEWEKSKSPAFVLALDGEEAWDYIEKMNTYGHYEQADPHAPTKEDILQLGGLTFIIARTSHGEIGFSLSGKVPNPPQESIDTLIRFAGVFDLAYKRFEDLKKAEKDLVEIKEARSKAEAALAELKSAQAQLIQSEKMASLGELTAGIAHEIQNPLNFVNNFSEVSGELIDEAQQEIDKGDLEEIRFILQDLKDNLSKINHHGKRAGSIVKGMLEHSRKSEGKKELVDLNALADECLKLGFHGLRAKDKSFSANFKADMNPALPQVSVVRQDIGRVLLNLINNAFYAVNELRKERGDDYEPIVTVSTNLIGNQIQISVADNGKGIPEHILEKIFQPFFTTKPTGEGTGLGLSLSYDIIKAHGGELTAINLSEGGAQFKITLPIV